MNWGDPATPLQVPLRAGRGTCLLWLVALAGPVHAQPRRPRVPPSSRPQLRACVAAPARPPWKVALGSAEISGGRWAPRRHRGSLRAACHPSRSWDSGSAAAPVPRSPLDDGTGRQVGEPANLSAWRWGAPAGGGGNARWAITRVSAGEEGAPHPPKQAFLRTT